MSEELSRPERVLIGCLGGLAAMATKYLGQDHADVIAWLNTADHAKMTNLAIGYAIVGPILLFLGGFVAWLSTENHRIKLAAIAVAAPALITTWAGGSTAKTKFSLNFIGSAIAQESGIVTEKDDVSVARGVKLFFGIGKDDDSKNIVVGGKEYRISGSRTNVRIQGVAGTKDSIKAGMDCTVTGANGEVTAIECREPSAK